MWVPYTYDSRGDPNTIAIRTLTDPHGTELGEYALLAQSRSRFIVPASLRKKADNYQFATWVDSHADELTTLGPGFHYGEWWGFGIQRGYGMAEKHFSLFDVSRWGEGRQQRPACCDVVPLLGYFTPDKIEEQVELLRTNGSVVSPGYMKPEGVVLWHSQSKNYFKILLEDDDIPKSLQE